jgi:phosphatidylglycerophosphate synthase
MTMTVHPGIPNALSMLRIGLAPVLVALAWYGANTAFACVYFFSLLTDIADGYIARRFGLTSELGARLDSWGDILTYLAVLPGLWWLQPRFVDEAAISITVVVCSYLVPIAAGFAKYRQLTSYHTRLATVAAYALGASLLLVFITGSAWPFRLAMAVIVISQIEEIAITLTLPVWRANIPSIQWALRNR